MASQSDLRSPARKSIDGRISATDAALCIGIALILLFYSRLPLAHLDLWGHLAWGRWIVEHGRLPLTEPFMLLAKDVSVVDSAWLSQVLGYLVERNSGPTGLQFLNALCIAGCCTALVVAIRRRARAIVPALAGLLILLATQWFQWRIIRPQIAGQLAYVLLIALLAAREYRRPAFALVPLLFVFWTNAHGSFVMGIALMTLTATGRAIDIVMRTRNVRGPIDDPFLRRLMGLLLLAAIATMVNPYGVGLHREVAQFSRNPNLRDLLEWEPMSFSTWQGRLFGLVAMLSLLNAAVNRRHLRFREGLPVVVVGVATIVSARFIVWWGPLAACGIARGADLLLKRSAVRRVYRPVRSIGWTACAAIGLVVAFALTPFGTRLLTGSEPPLNQTLSRRTPLAATAWLREHPPVGQMFNSYEWGDYLVWAEAPDIQVFVTSHVHVIPPPVWRDYRAISRGADGWEAGMDKYAVNTALIDLSRHPRLAKAMAGAEAWREVYRDRQAVIFERRR